MNYIYISSGFFGAQVLEHLDPKPTLVITMSDRLGGRGMKELLPTAVKKLCLELKIPFVEVENKQDLRDKIYELRAKKNVDSNLVSRVSYLFLLSDFRMIVPPELLKINEYGIWNIHPSLLPKYQGTTPIQTALTNGEKVTGVTLMQMDDKIDQGPIIAQEKLDIDINDTNITLQQKLAKLGAKLFNLQTSRPLDLATFRLSDLRTFRPQDHSQMTYTKKLTKEDGFIPLEQLAPYLEPLFKKYNLLHLLKEKDVIARTLSEQSESKGTKQPSTTELLPGSLATLGTSLTLRLHNKIRALVPWPTVWTKLPDESVVKITRSTYDEKAGLTTITEIERNGKKYIFA